MYFRKKMALITSAFVLSFFFGHLVRAMPVGTLLYRTSNDGNLYGYNTDELVVVKNKMIKNIYTGHVGIYIGKENGVDYIVEAMPNGIIKIPAKYFLNSKNGEELIGAKIPKNLSEIQRIKIAELAKSLAKNNLGYDFSFKKQKGPNSGEWICVGLTEKIYESANISNPLDLDQLEYDPRFYGVNITPDGFDNYSVINSNNGDCLSKSLEFSKISADRRTLIPFPEIFGFNAGKEYDNGRYFFFPLTQYWQNSLEDVVVDIDLESDFSDDEIRGKVPELAMIFKWSFINNPLSSINNLFHSVIAFFKKEEPLLPDSDIKMIANNNLSDDYNYSVNSLEEDGDSITGVSKINIDSNIDIVEESQAVLGKIKSSISIKEASALAPDLALINNGDLELSNFSTEEELSEEAIIFDKNLDLVKKLVISRVYTTLNDDYIELYNPTNQAINLEEMGVRLYKTKTSASPSLMMRIGHLDDGSYPGGVIIPAKGKYLIVRTTADPLIKDKAQAIAVKSSFTFTGSAYTIYLGNGVISSDSDEDIVDKVGFGSAKYFEKRSALEIPDNHVLVRKAKSDSTVTKMKEGGTDFNLGNAYDSDDNFFDFLLISLSTVDNNIDNPIINDSNSNSNSNSNSTSNNIIDTQTNNQENDSNTSNNNNEEEEVLLPLLISRIYTTAKDDYIQIYNPNNKAINLKDAGARLYKAKTSVTPTLMARIGNDDDGTYPGGLIIDPLGKYLVTGDLASDEIKTQAQAIINRDDFNLTSNGYTVYLGKSTISSDSDEDIIDKVGFGSAVYYYESPAPEILDDHVLIRKALATSTSFSMNYDGDHYSLGHNYNTKNNSLDFVLLDLNYQENDGDNLEEENGDGEEEDQEEENQSGDEDDGSGESSSANPSAGLCLDPGIYSDNIIHSWHLDECSGTEVFDGVSGTTSTIDSLWNDGKFGCGLKQYYPDNYFTAELDPSFSSNNFTLFFYYKNIYNNSRPMIRFSNSQTGSSFRIKLYPSNTDFYNIPGAPARDYDLVWPNDDNWHLFSWVVNKPLNYWALYRDGVEVYRVELELASFISVDTIGFKGDNGYNLIDEIAVFDRALSSSEIERIAELDLPFNSSSCQPNIKDKQLLAYWNLNETIGDTFYDFFNLDKNNASSVSLKKVNDENNCLAFPDSEITLSHQFSNHFYHKDLSLSFWFKNKSVSSSSDFVIKLLGFDKNLFGLDFRNRDWFYLFNNSDFNISLSNENFIEDEDWHNVVLSYDSYLFRLSLFVDGELKGHFRKPWIDGYFIEKLNIQAQGGDYYFDELGLWQGGLNLAEAEFIYQNQKNLFIE
ncbi:MAG: LamG-like jellyroll fold domain-containing protein [Patescibacteria group bacterium]|jgi:hypothetical protein